VKAGGEDYLLHEGNLALIYYLMPDFLAPQEEATIRAFIVRERQERFLTLLANPKRRRKVTDSLFHPNPGWFDSRYVKSIPPAQSGELGIARILQAKGAGQRCWAISADRKLDAREFELESILAEIVGRDTGAILCCVPGKLAFVESEDGRFILER
jgi:hypothetical protein